MKRLWLQRFTSNMLKHRVYAVSLAFVSTLAGVVIARSMSGLPVFVGLVGLTASITLTLLGILIAALMTLMCGPIIGGIATIAATLPYLSTLYFPAHGAPDTAVMAVWVWMGLAVAVISNILTWVFAVMLRQKTSWSSLIQTAALLGVLIVSVVHLAYPNVTDWWGTQLHALQAYYQQAETVSTAKMAMPEVTVDTQAEITDVVKQFVDGVLVVLVLLNAMFQLALARWWQSEIYSTKSLGLELHTIRLSKLAGGLFILSLALAYLGNSVVLDVMPIIYVLFGVAGLSLVHYIFKRMDSTHAWFWLMVFYMIVFFTLPFSVVMIAMLALFDIWVDVRKRVTKV